MGRGHRPCESGLRRDPPLSRPESTSSAPRGGGRLLLAVVGVLLVASCLRPAITAVGPVLHRIGDSTGLDSSTLGLLGSLPLLAFAAVSPFAHLVARRLGLDRTVLLALVVLVAGLLLRSSPLAGWGQIAVLLSGTLILGAGIAVGNVLVPAVVKRDFPGHVSRLTGGYTSTMNTFAALASGLSVPIAGWAVVNSDGSGWRIAIGIWAVPATLAALVWLARMRTVTAPSARPATIPTHRVSGHRRPSVWRSALAWQVTLNMGLQSTVFYTLATWLPSIEADRDVSDAVAGTHLFLYQAVGIFAALAVSAVAGRLVDQQRIAILITVPMMIALTGLLVAPELVVLWAMCAGLTSGSSVTLALALMGLRTRDPIDTARLSGMAQSMGYLLAAGGPLAAGAIHQLTGSWIPVILMLLGLTAAQAVFGGLAGRLLLIGDPPPRSVSGASRPGAGEPPGPILKS